MLVDAPECYTVPHFGPHLHYDAFGCDDNVVRDVELMRKFLTELPEQIGMTRISEAHVFEYHGVVPEDWGLTGGVFLAESHCTFHTFPENDNFVTLDIYTCKSMVVDEVVSALNEFFKPSDVRTTTILRGVGFKRNGNKIPELPAASSSEPDLSHNDRELLP